MKRNKVSYSKDVLLSTMDELEESAEKNLKDAERRQKWACDALAGATLAASNSKLDVTRAELRLQIIKDLKKEKDY